jgi:CRISPR system Cascade subunit CasC
MTHPRFIEIHWLTAYPAALLNRDQDGLGKRMPFGGTVRGRVSSQCIKRHLRFAGGVDFSSAQANEWSIQNLAGLSEMDFGKRSRKLLSEALVQPLIQSGSDPDVVSQWSKKLSSRLFPTKKESVDDDTDEADVALDDTKQAFLLGQAEVNYLGDLLKKAVEGDLEVRAAMEEKPPKKGLSPFQKQVANDLRKNLARLGKGAKIYASVEAALFGRMVTSDVFANVDAAVHVAHALTVHPIEREMDFMSVVDDIKREDETADPGAAGTFDAELTSGLYYNYMVVDVAGLTANLGGDHALAGQVVERLIHLAAEVSPGAKKGSTAPYAYAELVLVETGSRQPRTLGNAFREPVRARTNTMFADTLKKLSEYVANVDRAYGSHRERRLMTVDPTASVSGAPRMSLDELASWARQQVAQQAPGAAVA